MAETKPPQNDKSKKSRSVGSYVLFLLVLLAIFIAVGGLQGDSKTVTLEQFEHALYTGEVATLEVEGESKVEGLLANREPYSVSVHDVKSRAERYQRIKSQQPYRPVEEGAFLRALDEGWYRAEDARIVTSREKQAEAGATGKEGEGASARPPVWRQSDRVFVGVTARSEAEWREKHAEGGKPPFPLPEATGTLWVEVQKVADLPALAARFSTGGVDTERLAFNLSKDGVTHSNEQGLWTTVLIYYLPWLLIIVVIIVIMRQMRSQGAAGGVMSFGRSRAQLYTKENHTNVTFDDVAGADEAKDEVREIVEFLKNPGRFTRIGGRIPRGVLLVGPPGCGKTLLAKAIAGEAEVPFFSISGSDFVEMFVGVGASRVRDLFKQARENSPCIIFLDEIDAVGRRRGSGLGGGHDEREQTLNAILVEMDGFGTDEGIIVIAATNRPDVLDPALLRPGRFDREVVIDLPDVKGREQILNVHLRKVKFGGDVEVATLARSTPGYSGADLAAIINEAAIMAALQKQDEISMEHLEEARDKVRYGRQKKSRKLEEEDRRITAYHEAGHAVVASVLPDVDDPHKVTIVPRGRSLGATMVLPDKESYHMQKKRMVGQLAWAFGGRVAEALFCGDISAGAADDIRRATEVARAMVTELGMSERIGPINYAERMGSDFLGSELMSGKWHSEETAREIDQEVERLLKEAYETAERVVRENTAGVESISAALMRYETIGGEEVRRLLRGEAVEKLRPAAPPTPKPATPPGHAPERTPKAQPGGGELPGKPGLSPA